MLVGGYEEAHVVWLNACMMREGSPGVFVGGGLVGGGMLIECIKNIENRWVEQRE